ncbi:type II toxin-antitoxin system RelB/DinJ family antitoxin [Lacticaseibacillus casei]|uniref:type II toxin-antitoxin system RelB/DinJ family antitoxin n=2 Tax=Lacticaseibacillus TaxID=2759736 RepID=UPI001CDBFFAD|nr:type II toxin-antitoxin system antitoxin, RelB/DinJ family [Lacticaseibacillus casei]
MYQGEQRGGEGLQDSGKKKVTIAVKVSQADQQRAAGIFESLGLDLATAINIFIKKSIDEGGFPFEIKDPFYSEANQAELNRRFKKVANNQGIHSRQLSENED